MSEGNRLLALAQAATQRPVSSLTSVCSAHPLVLEAALRHGAATDQPVLIEATCNQVNQEGGYTGLTPADFHRQVNDMATTCGLRPGLLLLGGDHLGPNPWTKLPAEAALRRAEAMIAAYVTAGFGKLHLDTSMPCADDTLALTEEIIATRATRLAVVAEATARRCGLPPPLYVVGTEVPPPGGARELIEELQPTDPANAASTIEAHATAFAAAGIRDSIQRVIAIVVQPGVEFGTENVVEYTPDPDHASALAAILGRQPGLVFEAHSTDYQPKARLAALIDDGFAYLKVGPGLTFALRETLYRLDAIEAALAPDRDVESLPALMERVMLASPGSWQAHYHGNATQQRLARHYSYSDRIRYYWRNTEVIRAVNRLIASLDAMTIPETLISQHMPDFLGRVRHGALSMSTTGLLLASVTDVLTNYDYDA